MDPTEAISREFNPPNETKRICDEMIEAADREIAATELEIDRLNSRGQELNSRRELLQRISSKHDSPIFKLIEEILNERLKRSAVEMAPTAIVLDTAKLTPDVVDRIKEEMQKPGRILEAASDRAMSGSAFNDAFDPLPFAAPVSEVALTTRADEPDPVREPFSDELIDDLEPPPAYERIDIVNADDERDPTDAEIEAQESEEDTSVAFYRAQADEGAGEERAAPHAGDAKAAELQAILGKTKQSDRGKVWRKILHSANSGNIGQFSVARTATAAGVSARTFRDAIEAFVAQGMIEILPYHDETWIKFQVLRKD